LGVVLDAESWIQVLAPLGNRQSALDKGSCGVGFGFYSWYGRDGLAWSCRCCPILLKIAFELKVFACGWAGFVVFSD